MSTEPSISVETDWRIAASSDLVNYEMFDFCLEEQCINLVRSLGLEFGVVEFVCDHQGKMWFMEVNPNGQWGFIEKRTGFEISKKLAAFLALLN